MQIERIVNIENIEEELKRYKDAIEAAKTLGNWWREDWSDFDGRTLRSQLNSLDNIISGKQTMEEWVEENCWERDW